MALAGTALVASLLAAGCSSPSATSGTAAGGNAANGTVAGQLLIQGDRDLINFARCMRAHGVQMSDPYHRPGHLGLAVDLPTQDAANRTAYAACDHYLRALVRIKQERTAGLMASWLPALTRYAQCMRAHDINMLDPAPGGEISLGDVPGMAKSGFGRHSPQFHSADASCRHLLPPGITDTGSGP
jgi:hypothetical protein